MTMYSTCASCGELMQMFRDDIVVHPCCPEPDDYMTHAVAQFQHAAAVDDEEDADRWARFIEDIDEAPPRLAESAEVYAGWGWPVFPLKPGEKEPATQNGFKDATTSSSVVGRWWKQNPNYNIGVACGHAFDAIDVDPPEGLLPWVRYRNSGHLPDVHGWSSTPGGGWHVLVEPSGDGNLVAMQGKVPGLDYRGRGGYIVVPPSVSTEDNGRRYRWSVKPSPKLVYTNRLSPPLGNSKE